MRLSLMLPPDSLMTRVSSWTIPVRSLPIAETARCCFICGWRLGLPAFAAFAVYRERTPVATGAARPGAGGLP